jgi:hypothetical protein
MPPPRSSACSCSLPSQRGAASRSVRLRSHRRKSLRGSNRRRGQRWGRRSTRSGRSTSLARPGPEIGQARRCGRRRSAAGGRVLSPHRATQPRGRTARDFRGRWSTTDGGLRSPDRCSFRSGRPRAWPLAPGSCHQAKRVGHALTAIHTQRSGLPRSSRPPGLVCGRG